MNTTQLLTLLAKRPGISAGDIVEALDAKLADVSAELRSLVDVGDVVKRREFDEGNGRQWFVYELSEGFMDSKGYQALLGLAVPAAPAAASVPDPAPAAEEPAMPHAPAVDPAPAAPVQSKESKTKVQLAVDFITANGPATADQLRGVMSLSPSSSVSTYLTPGRRSGKLQFTDGIWSLGSGEPAPALAIAPTVERRQENRGIDARAEVKDLESPVVDRRGAPFRELGAPVHRVAIWSDCTYELQTDGERVVLLTHDQVAALMTFIERIRSPA